MSTPASQGLRPSQNVEVWVMQTRSTVFLETMGWNRFGQPVGKELKIGPNAQGREFHISREDREENQRRILDPKNDPFRNGTFLRQDAAQGEDPNTVSEDALSTEQLLAIADLDTVAFEARVKTLGEVPARRLLEIGSSMDVGHRKITFLEEMIRDRFQPLGRAQDLEKAVRLS